MDDLCIFVCVYIYIYIFFFFNLLQIIDAGL